MMTKATLAFALIVSAAGVAAAQQDPQVGWVYTRFYRVHLRNGNCVDGDLVKHTDKEVVLRLPSGEISFRNDQIEKVEFVKVKSYNDPAILLSKKAPPKEAEAPVDKGNPKQPAAGATTPDLTDSPEALPSDISQDLANSVDQAIEVWKKSSDSEKTNLTDTLVGMGSSVAPYLEFLLEKRPRSLPLEMVALALVSLSEERFLDLSARLMNKAQGALRQAAVSGLAKATSPRRIPMLLEAMDDSDPNVWRPATDAILKATPSDADKRDLADQIAGRIRTAKNNLGLVLALARLGGRAAHDALWDLVNDSNENNRQIGLNGVAQLNDPDDGARVQGLLNDPSTSMRKSACLTIGKMKYQKAAPDLINLLNDSNEGLQKNARWALSQVTGALVGDTNEGWKEWWENFGKSDERFK